jgi:hypothetical protein
MYHVNCFPHPHECSDEILKVIKSSNLHFNIQETPHSVYITIRKKFVREPSMKVPNQVFADKKFVNLEKAYDNLKYDFNEEIDNHRESQNIIKLLEEKLGETEAKFIREANKFQAEKETFVNQIKLLEDSNKMIKLNDKAEGLDDPPSQFGKLNVENAKEITNEVNEIEEPDENQNSFIPAILVSNKFQAFSSSFLGITTLRSTLSNPSTMDTSASADSSPKQLPRSPPSSKSKLLSQATPPLQDKNQLSLSFRFFLEDFKNDEGDKKYIKLAKEMISYNRN